MFTISAGQNQIIGKIAVVAVDKFVFEFLPEIVDGQSFVLVDDVRGTKPIDADLSVHVPGDLGGDLYIYTKKVAQPPGYGLAGVPRVRADLLGGDLPEQTSPPKRRRGPRELTSVVKDQRGAARVHLPVIAVVGELVQVDIGGLAPGGLGRRGQDSGLSFFGAVGFEGELSLGVVLEECSPQFRNLFWRAGVVVSKGQANYETLDDIPRTVFFILRAKCPIIAEPIGISTGSSALLGSEPEC